MDNIKPSEMVVFALLKANGVLMRDFSAPWFGELQDAVLVILYTETDEMLVWKDALDLKRDHLVRWDEAELLIQTHQNRTPL